jgi:hypothetical protein
VLREQECVSEGRQDPAASNQHWSELLHPPVHTQVIDDDVTLGQQLVDVSVGGKHSPGVLSVRVCESRVTVGDEGVLVPV